MRAAFISQYGQPYALGERPLPEVEGANILLRVHVAGFCHSDLQVLKGQFSSPLGMIPSHEPAGVIAKVGPEYHGDLKVGDRVGALNFKHACGSCTGCKLTLRTSKQLDPRFCDKRETAGFQHDGAFADYMVVDPQTVVKLPQNLSFEQAAPLMCAGATVWGSLERVTAGLQPGEAVGILGIGGLGHLGVQFSKALGFRTIAIDNRLAGCELASQTDNPKLQADHVINSSDPAAASRSIYDLTSGEGLAAVVACTDSLAANQWALTLLRVGGNLGLLGLPPDLWRFDASVIVFKELSLRGTYVASQQATERMMDIVNKARVRSHITCIDYEQIPDVVSMGNPVRAGDVTKTLQPFGLEVKQEESGDYELLLAAVHDCAEHVMSLEDYQPAPDLVKYPRENVRRPTADEQAFGNAWAHRFYIRGNRSPASLLKGKTICVKDCIAVAGVPQSYGSDAFPSWTPQTDATVISRSLEAGADIVGTATCENFCNSTSSFTSAQGIVENPHKAGYSAGGSTSGGAALVAGGLVDLAIGTDQGGSIRVPASLCGCVGFKPTHGLIPYTGVTSGDQIDDHTGPIARNVADVAACLDAIAGYDGIDDRSLGSPAHGSFQFSRQLKECGGGLKGVRVGILTEGYNNSLVQPGIRKVFLETTKKLAELGAEVEELSIPLHKEGGSVWTIQQRISGAEGILGHANGRRGLYLTEFETARLPWTTPNFQKLFPSTKNTVINGIYLMNKFPGLYGKTVNIGRQIRDAYERAFQEYDVIIMPTTPFVAPKHGNKHAVLESFEPSIGMTTNTAIFNVTGHPALSLPIGKSTAADDNGLLLPVGMQIVGGLWQEKKILRTAYALEKSFDWSKNVYESKEPFSEEKTVMPEIGQFSCNGAMAGEGAMALARAEATKQLEAGQA
ncbi:Amidase [Paramyrothecium foliicola]|nr:Amidase [Paramyrothecium foliicola]